jgi:hypothetical protein
MWVAEVEQDSDNDCHEQQNSDHQNTTTYLSLPWDVLWIIYAIVFSDTILTTIIYPLSPSQCKTQFHFPPENVGLCSGTLTGVYSIGLFISSFFFGHLADQFGRKSLMMAGLFFGFIFTTLYGWAPTYWVAVFARFFGGLTDPNLVLTKSACADITTGSQRAAAFAYLWAIAALSRIFSGIVSSFLILEKYQLITPNNNPFFFPCFVAGFCNLIVLFLSIFFLPETNQYHLIPESEINDDNEDNEIELQNIQLEVENNNNQNNDTNDNNYTQDIDHDDTLLGKFRTGFQFLLSDRLQILICGVYLLNAFANGAIYNSLFIYLSTPQDKHGYGLTTSELGIVSGWMALSGLLYQAFCFKPLAARLTNYQIYVLAIALFVIGCLLQPLPILISSYIGPPKVALIVQYILVGLTYLPISCAIMSGMCSQLCLDVTIYSFQNLFLFFILISLLKYVKSEIYYIAYNTHIFPFSLTFYSRILLLALSMLGAMQSNITPPNMQGLAIGLLQSIQSFFRSFGPILGGIAFDYFTKIGLH